MSLSALMNSSCSATILGVLCNYESTYCSEIARVSKLSKQSVHRYLKLLEEAGIVITVARSNRKYYQLSKEHEFYSQIEKLFQETEQKQILVPDENNVWRAN